MKLGNGHTTPLVAIPKEGIGGANRNHALGTLQRPNHHLRGDKRDHARVREQLPWAEDVFPGEGIRPGYAPYVPQGMQWIGNYRPTPSRGHARCEP